MAGIEARFSNRKAVSSALAGGNDFAGRHSRGTGLRPAAVGILRKPQREEFVRPTVHQDPRVFSFISIKSGANP